MSQEQPEHASFRVCQVELVEHDTPPATAWDRRRERWRRAYHLARVRLGKTLRDPLWIPRRLLRGPRPHPATGAPASATPVEPSLGLQPGDRVRVRSLAEIHATLDAEGKFQGMAYLGAVMDRYCGRELTVKGRVDRFFDERNWRMVRLRDTVILEGGHCTPESHLASEWAGCQRACYLFWKEAWLERIGPEA